MTPIEKAEARHIILEHLEEVLADCTMDDESASKQSDKELSDYLGVMQALATMVLNSLSFEIVSEVKGIYNVNIKLVDIHTFIDDLGNTPIVE